jgi:hypothetical protein
MYGYFFSKYEDDTNLTYLHYVFIGLVLLEFLFYFTGIHIKVQAKVVGLF